MNKITNALYQETYYEETLDNGLHVVLWHKPNFEKSYFLMATPLGALDLEQVDEQGNELIFPAGIAHFLEHKMFEDQTGDMMDKFAALGVNVNAFTSYSETVYYFSTTADVEKPLTLLLDLVQNFHITPESVEKEKGIIIQELNMYKQMSDSRLLMETFSSLYAKHPFRFDIGGDDESVTSITYDQLQQCYQCNYHPSKMVLIGVSGNDPEVLMKQIKQDQANRTFPTVTKVERIGFVEPHDVARPTYTFEMDVTSSKTAIAFKLDGIVEWQKRLKREWAFRILLDATFTSLNPDYQQWLDDKVINDYFGYDADFGTDFGFLLFYNECEDTKAFQKFVCDALHEVRKRGIHAKVLDQLKRRYFGQSIRSLNNFDDIAVTYIRNYFQGIDFFDTMDMAMQIQEADLWEALDTLEFEREAVICLVPKK